MSRMWFAVASASLAGVFGLTSFAAASVPAGVLPTVSIAETGALSVSVRSGPMPLTSFVIVESPDVRLIGVSFAGAPAVFAGLEPGDYTVSSLGQSTNATVVAGETTAVSIIVVDPSPPLHTKSGG